MLIRLIANYQVQAGMLNTNGRNKNLVLLKTVNKLSYYTGNTPD